MTEITKEAIERPERVQAAFEVWRQHPETGPNASAMFEYIEHLEAALSALPIAGEGKVKALEWTGEEGGPGHDVYAKPSGYHHYTVRHLSEAKFDVILHTDTGSIWFAQEKRGNYHGTYAEAKAAAQADYDLRGAEFSSPGKDGGQEVEAVKPLAPVDVYKVLKSWSDHGSLDIDHLSAISREVAALARPQPASTALVEAPSPQSTVDADAVIERCALAADAEGSRWTKDEATTAFGQAYQHACANVSIAIRALKAKSPSSDRAASEGVEKLTAIIADGLKECDRSQRPSYAWQMRAKAALAEAKGSGQ